MKSMVFAVITTIICLGSLAAVEIAKLPIGFFALPITIVLVLVMSFVTRKEK